MEELMALDEMVLQELVPRIGGVDLCSHTQSYDLEGKTRC